MRVPAVILCERHVTVQTLMIALAVELTPDLEPQLQAASATQATTTTSQQECVSFAIPTASPVSDRA
jgi:hypothetical protein